MEGQLRISALRVWVANPSLFICVCVAKQKVSSLSYSQASTFITAAFFVSSVASCVLWKRALVRGALFLCHGRMLVGLWRGVFEGMRKWGRGDVALRFKVVEWRVLYVDENGHT